MYEDQRKIQEADLLIFNVFLEICEKYNLDYFPADGTLLGAIRHHGFIPWDDDMDISLPRKSFEKLAAVLKYELPDNMYYSYFKDADYDSKEIHYGIKIYSKDLQVITNFSGQEKKEDICIDIVPLDGMPNSILQNKIQQIRLLSLKAILKISQITNVGTYINNRPLIDRIIISFGFRLRFDRFLNTKKWCGRLDNALKKYDYDVSSKVVLFWSDYRFREMVPKSCYEPTSKVRFEDLEINCPGGAELILSQIYGNYLEYPPEESRQKHPIRLS